MQEVWPTGEPLKQFCCPAFKKVGKYAGQVGKNDDTPSYGWETLLAFLTPGSENGEWGHLLALSELNIGLCGCCERPPEAGWGVQEAGASKNIL
jgi:hypothetical protein